MLEISFVSTADQKEKSSENEKEREEAKPSTKSLYEYLFERETRERTIRQRTKQFVLTEENLCLGDILKLLMLVLQLK